MDPSTAGIRLASTVIGPLIRKLFVRREPGAGLTGAPVRLSALVSFRGEKRTLTTKDLHRLAAELVRRAIDAAGPGERPVPADEDLAVAGALATSLGALGDLDMDDVQAVHLGATELAARLTAAAPGATRDLSRDAEELHRALLTTSCLHIIHFFTQRSTFTDRTLVEHSRRLNTLIADIDTLIARLPSARTADAAFEREYLGYIARKHSRLTIYGIDLTNSPDRWPLDAAYLSLRAAPRHHPDPGGLTGPDGLGAEPAPPPLEPADRALAHLDRVLLRGVAGSGKSTLVQWLAVGCTRPPAETPLPHLSGRIPFVLPLRTLHRAATLPTVDRFLSAVGCPVAGSQPQGWAGRVLAEGRGLLLVDGLDEIPEADRRRTLDWLRDLLDAFPDAANLWLVTTRPSAVREDWLAAEGFTEQTLAPMGREEVAAFIARWHAAARPDAPDPDLLDAYETSLLTAVRTKQDLARLATNPLMCGLLCALHRDRRGYLPTGRKELYDAALTMLLARRDRERDMRGPDGIELSDEPQIQLLQRLAYWLIRNGRTELDRTHAERLIAQALPSVPVAAAQGDAPQIFRHLLLRSGLLREPTPGSVDFVHRTFQDYLGAKAAIEDGDLGLLVQHAADSQWEDVIRMAVAHARPRERAEFLTELVAHGDGIENRPLQLRVHLLALACLEHATELDPGVRKVVESRADAVLPPREYREVELLAEVGPFVLELLPGPGDGLTDEEARMVVNTAALIGTDGALEVLKRFLNHPAPNVHHELADAWMYFDTAQYAEEVIRHLGPDVPLRVNSHPELQALKSLGTRTEIWAHGNFTEPELVGALDVEALTSLTLTHNTALDDLAFLQRAQRLEALTLSLGAPGLTPPAGLTTLRELVYIDADPGFLHATFNRATAWPLLRSVQLTGLTADFGEEQWVALAHCPELREFALGVHDEAPLCIPAGLQLSQVTELSLIGEPETPGTLLSARLRTALPHFPNVRVLRVYGTSAPPTVFEVPPLTALPHLKELQLRFLLPAPGTALPPGVKLTVSPQFRD
ncbi:NACHT domain-containing protein [Streptomyces catenulae]|uniref:NACHT domain-containing protein n=1 Tax=Streptomyces catenulae TaxID=66875 RepID=A0ABV2Z7T7_9ACTN|nr:NACHT domain-containing protein [Streptomyces catenulae]